jgi:single-strand DNA-binding protein
MANFNKVLLMGNLTRDPQLSYLPSQTAVVDFGLAVNRRWTGKDGQTKEEVCFVDCRAFGKPAETINKYLSKGRAVFVEGRLTLDSWTAQDGTKRSKHRVTVENFQFLGAPPAGPAAAAGDTGQTADDQRPQTDDKQQMPEADDIPF